MEQTVRRVWELAQPLAAGQGVEIVDIEFRCEGHRGGRVLRLYIDKADGAKMEDLSRMSRAISEVLDHEDAIDGSYTLEVSSPGVNRPLTRPDHFVRFVGKRIRVRTRDKINGRRSFLGVLDAVENDRISLTQDGAEFEIPFSMIEKSNYEHDWSA